MLIISYNMFSLKPKPKNQPQKNSNTTPNKQQQNKDGNAKSKGHSKKIAKTVFEDPFIFRIELLPQEEADQTQTLLINYLKKLRESMPFKPPSEGIIKTIKFQPDPNLKQKQSPLISPQIAVGIKRVKQILYAHYTKAQKTGQLPHLTIIFYEQKKHAILQELLCLLKFTNSPYLIVREQQEVNRLLGVRTAGSLCLMNEEFANSLLKYIGKCLIQIPWLIDMQKLGFSQTHQMNEE